jgi:SAM-dependent methyltransferase
MTLNDQIERHYAQGDIVARLKDALRATGKDPARLINDDLAAFDQFHVRGREATMELAAKLNLGPGMRLLDIGSGIGGPSRMLAQSYGCQVVGVDLTAEYCRAADEIARWVGLSHLVEYRQADALSLPFPDRAFDVVWTQHVAMNIPDKAKLYGEARRVLKPAARFALYDVLQGAGGRVHYPVPWARDPETSFLVTPDALRALLEDAGFVIESWRNTTALGRDWFAEMVSRMQAAGAAAPSAGVLLLGAEFPRMAANMARNLAERRTVLIEAICRPA